MPRCNQHICARTLLLQWISNSICCVTIPTFTMPPKKSHKSFQMQKLNAQLDHFLQICTCGTQAGSSLTGVSAHPPSCPLKKPAGLHAQSTEVVPSTAPSASYSGSEPRFLAQSGAHSVPLSPSPCDTGGLDDLDPLSVGAFEASKAQAGSSAPGAPSQELIQPKPLEGCDLPLEDNLTSLIPLPDLQMTHRFSMAQHLEGEIIWSVDMTCMQGKAVALDDLDDFDVPKTLMCQTRTNTMTLTTSMASLHLCIHLHHFLPPITLSLHLHWPCKKKWSLGP